MTSPGTPTVTRTRLATHLPDVISQMLRSAHQAEKTAQGANRRAAFELTRSVLGGAHKVGYPVRLLAECLGVSHKSLHARCGTDGWISAEEIVALTGRPSAAIARSLAGGRISSTADADDGTLLFLASEVVQSLAARHRE